jgi:phage shock protein PspC (stress-responsive transcriptional regulator)
MSAKRLKRSESNHVIAGLFGGLGEYLDIDANLLRLAGVVLLILAPDVMT